jgi:hypothetical protein
LKNNRKENAQIMDSPQIPERGGDLEQMGTKNEHVFVDIFQSQQPLNTELVVYKSPLTQPRLSNFTPPPIRNHAEFLNINLEGSHHSVIIPAMIGPGAEISAITSTLANKLGSLCGTEYGENRSFGDWTLLRIAQFNIQVPDNPMICFSYRLYETPVDLEQRCGFTMILGQDFFHILKVIREQMEQVFL